MDPCIVAEPEVGEIYDGKVVKIMDFGAFVNFIGKRDGLVHISELAEGGSVSRPTSSRKDETVKVKVLASMTAARVKLSMRVVDQETGEDISAKMAERDAERRAERDARKAEGGDDEDKSGEDRPRRRRPRNDD